MAAPVLGLPLWMWLFAGVVLVLLVLATAKARPLRVDRLWISPVLVAATSLLAVSLQGAPGPLPALVYAAALAVGAAAGWWIGRHTEIRPDDRGLVSQLSPFGLMIVLVLVAARIGLREALTLHASALGLSAAEVADAFLLMAVGLVSARGFELWRRGRRVLAGAMVTEPAE